MGTDTLLDIVEPKKRDDPNTSRELSLGKYFSVTPETTSSRNTAMSNKRKKKRKRNKKMNIVLTSSKKLKGPESMSAKTSTIDEDNDKILESYNNILRLFPDFSQEKEEERILQEVESNLSFYAHTHEEQDPIFIKQERLNIKKKRREELNALALEKSKTKVKLQETLEQQWKDHYKIFAEKTIKFRQKILAKQERKQKILTASLLKEHEESSKLARELEDKHKMELQRASIKITEKSKNIPTGEKPPNVEQFIQELQMKHREEKRRFDLMEDDRKKNVHNKFKTELQNMLNESQEQLDDILKIENRLKSQLEKHQIEQVSYDLRLHELTYHEKRAKCKKKYQQILGDESDEDENGEDFENSIDLSSVKSKDDEDNKNNDNFLDKSMSNNSSTNNLSSSKRGANARLTFLPPKLNVNNEQQQLIQHYQNNFASDCNAPKDGAISRINHRKKIWVQSSVHFVVEIHNEGIMICPPDAHQNPSFNSALYQYDNNNSSSGNRLGRPSSSSSIDSLSMLTSRRSAAGETIAGNLRQRQNQRFQALAPLNSSNASVTFIPWSINARKFLHSLVTGEIPFEYHKQIDSISTSFSKATSSSKLPGGQIKCMVRDLRTSNRTASLLRSSKASALLSGKTKAKSKKSSLGRSSSTVHDTGDSSQLPTDNNDEKKGDTDGSHRTPQISLEEMKKSLAELLIRAKNAKQFCLQSAKGAKESFKVAQKAVYDCQHAQASYKIFCQQQNLKKQQDRQQQPLQAEDEHQQMLKTLYIYRNRVTEAFKHQTMTREDFNKAQDIARKSRNDFEFCKSQYKEAEKKYQEMKTHIKNNDLDTKENNEKKGSRQSTEEKARSGSNEIDLDKNSNKTSEWIDSVLSIIFATADERRKQMKVGSDIPSNYFESLQEKKQGRKLVIVLRPTRKSMIDDLHKKVRKKVDNVSDNSNSQGDFSVSNLENPLDHENESSTHDHSKFEKVSWYKIDTLTERQIQAERLLLLALHPTAPNPPRSTVPDETKLWAEPGWHIHLDPIASSETKMSADDSLFEEPPLSPFHSRDIFLPNISTKTIHGESIFQNSLSECCSAPGRQAASIIRPRHLSHLMIPFPSSLDSEQHQVKRSTSIESLLELDPLNQSEAEIDSGYEYILKHMYTPDIDIPVDVAGNNNGNNNVNRISTSSPRAIERRQSHNSHTTTTSSITIKRRNSTVSSNSKKANTKGSTTGSSVTKRRRSSKLTSTGKAASQKLKSNNKNTGSSNFFNNPTEVSAKLLAANNNGTSSLSRNQFLGGLGIPPTLMPNLNKSNIDGNNERVTTAEQMLKQRQRQELLLKQQQQQKQNLQQQHQMLQHQHQNQLLMQKKQQEMQQQQVIAQQQKHMAQLRLYQQKAQQFVSAQKQQQQQQQQQHQPSQNQKQMPGQSPAALQMRLQHAFAAQQQKQQQQQQKHHQQQQQPQPNEGQMRRTSFIRQNNFPGHHQPQSTMNTQPMLQQQPPQGQTDYGASNFTTYPSNMPPHQQAMSHNVLNHGQYNPMMQQQQQQHRSSITSTTLPNLPNTGNMKTPAPASSSDDPIFSFFNENNI